jgi:hypothetical protein
MHGRLGRGIQQLARSIVDRTGADPRPAGEAARAPPPRLASLVKHRRALATALAVFAAAAVAFRWARHSAGFWSIDDAAITYAAAFELADHGSLAAYVEGTPVESYSNPLVFFVVAALRALGCFDPITTHMDLAMLVFAGMVVIVWSMLRRLGGELAALAGAALFVAAQLAATPTWLWYGSGLENAWVSAGLVAMLWLCVRTACGVALAPAWGAVGCLAAMTRPEAPVYVAGFYVALALCARPAELTWRAHARQVAGALAVTTVLYAGFLCWRRISYGDWLPNTYYAKMFGERDLVHNVRVSVLQNLLPSTRLLASSAIALLFVTRARRIGASLLVLLVAALALPITVGEDWGMGGGHRFWTPFLTMCHAAFAVLAAVCIAGVARAPRRVGRIAAAVGLVAVAILTARLLAARIRRAPVKLNEVTIADIGATQGGMRWEHQMRLGVPYAVSLIPDAGGSLLVGGMQMVDYAYLADFVMAHIGRANGEPGLMREVNQYQHEERRPDLVDNDTAIGDIDPSVFGTRYLAGAGQLLARRDLVAAAPVDAGARPVFDDGRLRVYLSDETVRSAVPGALVRCELIVAWTDMALDDRTQIRAFVENGDGDEIALRPYQPGPSGVERRALLLGAPPHAGRSQVMIQIVRDGRAIFIADLLALDVHADARAVAVAGVAPKILEDGDAMRAARRLAWLREQLIPRLGMTAFRRTVDDLVAHDRQRSALAGEDLLLLRWNARLASIEGVPPQIREAEVMVARRLFAACPAASTAPATAMRTACLGRVIDELRRLGFLGMLARVPEIAGELSRARAAAGGLPLDQRYQTLVGLTLADPSSIALQRDLIAARRRLERYPGLPGSADRASD